MDGVWASARACMATYLLLAEKAQAFRADPRGAGGHGRTSGVLDLAQPDAGRRASPSPTSSPTDDGFDPDKAGRARLRLRAPQQLALEHALGARLS